MTLLNNVKTYSIFGYKFRPVSWAMILPAGQILNHPASGYLRHVGSSY